jgi:hypothetical protein
MGAGGEPFGEAGGRLGRSARGRDGAEIEAELQRAAAQRFLYGQKSSSA